MMDSLFINRRKHMMKSNLKAVSRAAVILLWAAAGASAANAQTVRLPNALLPRVAPWPTDGSDPTTQWRVPNNAVTPAQLADMSAVEQTLNAWAQSLDSADPSAVASMFTSTGTLGLYYINQTTAPWTEVLTGYSPSSTPTGGTSGGGCTAAGATAIANYVKGTGLTAAYAWPVPAASRTLLLNTLVLLNSSDPTLATAHAYFISGVWGAAGNSAQNIFASFKFDPSTGWKISDLRLLYTTAQPTFPCQN